MSQKSDTIKKPETEKIKLVGKNPRKIKAALKSYVEASDKLDSDPLQLDDAPPWVEKAYAEVVKVVFPGNRIPNADVFDLEIIGEFFGRLQAFGKVYSGEIPLGPEALAECENAKKIMESKMRPPKIKAKVKSSLKDLQVRVGALQASIPGVMNAALESSHEDALKFQKGLLRGMILSQDELVSVNVFERHTRTYFVLAAYWQFWVKCRTLREVYNHLCKAAGEEKIGSFKTFEKVCGKIGFSVGKRGRPSKKK